MQRHLTAARACVSAAPGGEAVTDSMVSTRRQPRSPPRRSRSRDGRSGHVFWGGGVRSCLHVKSDSVHSCTETFSIFQEILRAKPDAGALMHPDTCPGFCCRRTCRSGPSLFSGKILRLREPDVERICRGSWFCLLHGSSHPGNEPYTGISAIVHPTLSGQTSFRLNDRLSIGSRKGVRKKTCRRYDASEGAYACPRGTQGTARVAHLNASIEEQSLDRSRRR
jgi:hypothetical protein